MSETDRPPLPPSLVAALAAVGPSPTPYVMVLARATAELVALGRPLDVVLSDFLHASAGLALTMGVDEAELGRQAVAAFSHYLELLRSGPASEKC